MSAQKPAGLSPIPVVGFLAGLALVLWAVYAPSINILWQVPVGALLIFSTVGKMSVR